jgi:hypothetical protein
MCAMQEFNRSYWSQHSTFEIFSYQDGGDIEEDLVTEIVEN